MSTVSPALTIGNVGIRRAENAIVWEAGLAVDSDGAPNAIHPDGSGLDSTSSAGRPGHWWGVETDTGEKDGIPYVQRATDPFPGGYVSATSLKDKTVGPDGKQLYARRDPRRYVDATVIPYLAVPPELREQFDVHFGDVARVFYWPTAKWADAIVADGGPEGKLGEGSIALAEALGIPSNPRNGGCSRHVAVALFPGSRRDPPWPRAPMGEGATVIDPAAQVADIEAQVEELFTAWGGVERLRQALEGR